MIPAYWMFWLDAMAQARVERATYCLGGSRSIHLSYWVFGTLYLVLTIWVLFSAHEQKQDKRKSNIAFRLCNSSLGTL